MWTTLPQSPGQWHRRFWSLTWPWAFLLDGIFIGTTRTAELRNSMFIALLVYLTALWLTFDTLGNHGIWLSMIAFMVARCALLGAYYPRLLRLAAAQTGA